MGAMGAVVGGVFGGVDAALGGESIVNGVVNGAMFGAALGFGLGFLGPFATTFLSPGVIAAIMEIGAGASLLLGAVGAADSFSQGNTWQGIFRIGVGLLGAYTLHRGAVNVRNQAVNIGGEGEALKYDAPKDVLNVQGRNALSDNFGRSQDTVSGPAGKSLAGMILEGLKFLIYDSASGRLPFADKSVPRVYTNSVPIDGQGHFPGIRSAEIWRILKPGGKWIHNGVEQSPPGT